MDTFTRKRDDGNKADGRKRKKSKAKKLEAEAAEEARLTAMLFGGVAPSLMTDDRDDTQHEEQSDDVLFEIDRTGGQVSEEETAAEPQQPSTSWAQAGISGDDNSVNDDDEEEDGDETNQKSGVAWVDEEDAHMKVNLLETSRLRKLRTSKTEEAATSLSGVELEKRMRERYQSTTGRTARTDWAEIDPTEAKEDDESEDDGIQGSSIPLLRSAGKRRLEPNTIDIARCPDANLKDPSKAVVRAVNFHPGSDPDSPLLLTAGLDKTLRFFQVGEEGSKKIHGIHFPKLPIYSASFLGDTGNVVVSGRRKFFYIYDAAAGKLDHIPEIIGRQEKSLEYCRPSPDGRTLAFGGNDGFIILYDARSKQWIADLKLNGNVRTIAFSPDGDRIVASGSDGDVYRWDMKSRKCVERFSNLDGTSSTSLALSSRHLAVGAKSGVVNLFSDVDSASVYSSSFGTTESQRTPIKSVMNLQSAIHSTYFNSDGQILAMATRNDQSGLKLMHVPTATVYANWPTLNTPLGYVWSMDFSSDSRFLAIGNDKGKCLLYNLKHYS